MNYYKITYNKIQNQKMELIDYKFNNNTHKFIILGYSRNVYTIEIMNDGYMKCNCPYALDDNFPCKHIFFIIFKVSPIFKKFYTNKKNLIYNFNSAPLNACKSSFLQDRMILDTIEKDLLKSKCKDLPNKSEYYNEELKKKYYKILSWKNNLENIIPDFFGYSEKDCNICLEEIKNIDLKCPNCKNVFHKKCIDLWLSKNMSCPLCKYTNWHEYWEKKKIISNFYILL